MKIIQKNGGAIFFISIIITILAISFGYIINEYGIGSSEDLFIYGFWLVVLVAIVAILAYRKERDRNL